MMVKVTSCPPLGLETVVSHDKSSVHFNVLLQTSDAGGEWEVDVWHNLRAVDEFVPSRLASVLAPVLDISQTMSPYHNYWFTGTLHGVPSPRRPVSFTIRFRAKGKDEFSWVQKESSVGDGKLFYQRKITGLEPLDISAVFKDRDLQLCVETTRSDTPGTHLWTLSAPVQAASGNWIGENSYSLGKPLELARWFAVTRLSGPWLGPQQGSDLTLASKDALLYSFLRTDGLFVVVLAISGAGNVVTLLREQNKSLEAFSRNDDDHEGVVRLAVAIGTTFDEANASVMYYARRLVSEAYPATAEEMELLRAMEQTSKAPEGTDLKANWREDWYDGFTYCTWNGLGQDLNEDKILTALDALRENGIQVTNLIIDDNWQSLDHAGQNQMTRGWKDFEANTEGFPSGLKNTINKIRKQHPNIKHIAVWHALLGYWGGISLEGSIAQNYRMAEMTTLTGDKFHVVDSSHIKTMYNDFYAFLSEAGVDAVKTDVQFVLEMLGPTATRLSLTNAIYSAWMIAQLRHFGGRAISCMSQQPTIMFRTLLPRNMPAVTFRNSDDFFPNIKESHPWHVFCNAHNSLMTSLLNVVPDWDMFQTGHEWAPFHAAARCLSGGPICITDVPGEHNADLIGEMTAKTIRGQTVILRCSCIGRSLRVYNLVKEERLLMVGAYHGGRGTGAGIVGIFNCLDIPVTDVVPLDLFMGVEDDTKYLVRSYRSGQISGIMQKSMPTAVVGLSFVSFSWDILTAVPVTEMAMRGGQAAIEIANFGVLDKMTGIAALLGASAGRDHSGRRVQIVTRMKALGRMGIWTSALRAGSALQRSGLKDNLMVTISGQVIPWGCISIGHASESGAMLEIDVEKAWDEMNLEAGWSNEVEVVTLLTPS